MASFIKFQPFVENLAEKVFDLGSDTLKVALTNTDPTAASGTFSQVTEITAQNGYSAGGSTATQSSSAQSSGTYKLVLGDVTITASGGSFGPFQYAVLYDDTAASDQLIGYWDYGTALTITNGNSLVVNFDGSAGVLTLV